MPEQESRKIPSPIKREVRQRCGFGCVICGIPLYEYDHIVEFSVEKKHKADNLTLLCDKHHREKTNNLLTLSQVQKANNNPYNIVNKLSTSYRFNFEGSDFNLKMGGCELIIDNINPIKDFIIPFLVNNKKLLSFEIINGQLFLNLVVFNNEGSLLLKIEENEMVYNTGQWDVEFIGTRMILRGAKRHILFDINFEIPNGVTIYQAQFNYQGYEFQVGKDYIRSKNVQLFSKTIKNFRVIFAVGEFDEKIPAAVRSSG